MMIGEQEISARCPYCRSKISFLCETTAGAQSYIEDCEVCCKPIQINYDTVDDEQIAGFSARRLDE